LMYQTIQQRVAYWLLSMNHLSEHERIPLPRSQTIWANTLHVSRSSLNQELKRMEKEGIFRIEGHALILLDQKKLEDIL
ncbi:helix-turn-helix domain-containing protein, partial [[Clostridium] scindens]